jgi:hypothetical protein
MDSGTRKLAAGTRSRWIQDSVLGLGELAAALVCGCSWEWRRNEEETLKIVLVCLYTCIQGPRVRWVRGFAGTGKTFLCPLFFYPRAQIQTRTLARGHKREPVPSP